jgi:hypothetical protein
MNPEQEEFQQLRRLLALKRYEQPPQGYFDDFSEQVIIRIRAGERIDRFSLWESLSWEAPWLQRLWAALETRPVLAGGFGVAVCGLLLAGMLYSEPRESALLPTPNPVTESEAPQQQSSIGIAAAAPATAVGDRVASPFSTMQGLAPAAPNDSLFQQLKNIQQLKDNQGGRVLNADFPANPSVGQ